MAEVKAGPSGPFLLPFVMFYSDHQHPLPVGLQYLLESTAVSTRRSVAT
jgi:hypothetical protein